MKILMLTQWFQPEPVFKGLPFAEELMKRGHSVTVVTGYPYDNDGNIFPGYKISLLKRENMNGVEVIRVPIYPSHSHSIIGRIADYLSFSTSAAIIGSVVTKRPDVMYVYHPPATVGMAGLVLKTRHWIPMVYDIQDLWPDTLSATGMINKKIVLSIVDKFCKIIYKGASRIVVLSPGFKNKLVERGVPSDKIDVIYNWAMEDFSADGPEIADPLVESIFSGKFNIVFAGNLGRAQGLENVLSAAALLMHSHPNIQFVFVGGGIEETQLKNKAQELQLTNVKFLPWRTTEEMRIVYRLTDVLIVHLKDEPLFSITIPGKTQKSLSTKKPVLMVVRGDATELIKNANAGICAEPGNPEALAEAAKTLYNMPPPQREQLGLNGYQFYMNELRMTAGVDKFEKIFRKLTGKQ
ncbi:MAG: glycosyltransferase family 4 protein [Bacteroidetes bacterium]|nr:glycosyltransferase family 4 protein [Bacteroidota bacterium]